MMISALAATASFFFAVGFKLWRVDTAQGERLARLEERMNQVAHVVSETAHKLDEQR